MSPAQPEGFLASPPTGKGSPVLVLHAWWGLNDTIKATCRRLADSGFVAFAPDLYHGNVTDQIAEAEALAGAVFGNLDPIRADAAQAAAFLAERAAPAEHIAPAEHGLAVIGFSLGAFFALDLSVTVPELIRSVVVYYGTRPGNYTSSQATYLGHFAEMDEFEPQSEVDALEQSLKQAGRPVTFFRYSGTGHWFCEPDRTQAYNQAAASLAWERTLEFLMRSPTK